ncbi:MAG TPA: nitrile hydratase subunit beta [Propylenella sp.]
MNGPHDLGGAHGFGPVAPPREEPVFHHPWEGRVFAINKAAGAMGFWHIDKSRHAKERIPPAEYLASSYYWNWLAGLERLLLEHGLVTQTELETGRMREPGKKPRQVLRGADVAGVLRTPYSYEREAAAPRRFAVGEQVRARVMHPTGHTRLPRYVRGRTGEVIGIRGCHVFPDSHCATDDEDPQWLYSVAFRSTELWGPQGRAGDQVILDLFEPYLERA